MNVCCDERELSQDNNACICRKLRREWENIDMLWNVWVDEEVELNVLKASLNIVLQSDELRVARDMQMSTTCMHVSHCQDWIIKVKTDATIQLSHSNNVITSWEQQRRLRRFVNTNMNMVTHVDVDVSWQWTSSSQTSWTSHYNIM